MHERLDRGVIERGALATREGYVQFLRASLSVVAPIERALAAFTEFPIAGRADKLRSDLAALGSKPATESADAALTRAEAEGAAYVIEGSALGGLVLARRVEAELGVDAEQTSYLRLRGDRTASFWREFIARLDRWGTQASDAERSEACTAAVHVFDRYLHAMQAVSA